jgi:hypothetical protein
VDEARPTIRGGDRHGLLPLGRGIASRTLGGPGLDRSSVIVFVEQPVYEILDVALVLNGIEYACELLGLVPAEVPRLVADVFEVVAAREAREDSKE